MTYLAATLAAFILGVTITVILHRAFGNKTIYFLPQIPRVIIKGAQHAANQSRVDMVVLFDGFSHRIVKAQNQYSVNGRVVHVAHPEAI